LRTKEDVKFSVQGYTGTADMYILPRDLPESPSSDKITLRGGHGPSKALVIKTYDR
jgi:hypothetical protein